ncbi:LON peptidase substrate-binding domain-containing protein [Photobacterium lipolyticum]|uniref:Lon protease n=1 Tax=Photobacterium lipolyticum TaxID=266810 RepID=A0A2T3MSQ2_9GAMM|nr:LON peptidase substrate-binding domain-containing protein [Photobacterium lipolyticum]PSW01135.1 Lon protease [Photobacterium lipolyticum]
MARTALLPSSGHVLPGGRLEITVAEAKYIRMVKESLASSSGFTICMINEADENQEVKKIPAIATLVNIVDFNALEGGLLGITVEGSKKIRLIDIHIDYDGLLIGEYKPYIQWHSLPISRLTQCLSDKLKLFYSTMPEIGALYSAPKYNDISWICQRWIEILPLEVQYKQLLITQESPKLTIRFLLKLLDTEYHDDE